MGLLKAITGVLGDSNEKALKDFYPIVEEINELEPEFVSLSDEELTAKTAALKSTLEQGEELNDILPEAFACVREVAKRTLGQRHYDVQLLGGMVLHEGKIAEMRTGEGKTLVATLPAYLNALTGKGVHVVTVNDYLARRDGQWMGEVYDRLGLTVGVLQNRAAYVYDASVEKADSGMEKLRPATRKEAYEADVTYGTNNEFGFDFLKDNMVIDIAERVQRPLAYGIVDEVDNILIDEARTPLIISAPAEESGKEYYRFAKLAPSLHIDEDYTIDAKHRAASLTTEGMGKLEKLLNVQNLYDAENFRLVHFVENALKAQAIFERDRDYVVNEGEVVIVDEFTGRMMPGRRYSDGIHQAIEAKEGLKVQRETITYATITLQNYFRLYDTLAGMTGTAATEGEEFWKIYKLDVVTVPTHLPMVREDRTDLIYKDQNAKYRAVVEEIEGCYKRGQPVLVGTTDISKSELISDMLRKKKVPNEILNAKQHEREASIIAQAGRPGAVTVATNMAGRGTDIVLGGNPDPLDLDQEQWQADHDKVVELGGLHIVGTERHDARRIDNQLRGRAGRQGDPGDSRFFVGLDDDLVRRFGGERIQTVMNWAGYEDDQPIENRVVSKSIEGAQIKVEAYHFDLRKHLVEYDDVVNAHRDIIYTERNKILSGSDLKANIGEMVEKELLDVLVRYLDDQPEEWDVDSLVLELQAIMVLTPELADPDRLAQMDAEEIEEEVLTHASRLYEQRESELTPELMRRVEREVMLRIIDSHWVQHLTNMENLRQGIGLQAYGQRDPLVMYKKEGHETFQNMQAQIQGDIVHTIFHIGPQPADGRGRKNGQVKKATRQEKSVMANVVGRRSQEAASTSARKVGRNEPCPCGSGKKYKRCHGAS